jgi:Kdo2-lipid IVA lauroyltransferase/acyltransferase
MIAWLTARVVYLSTCMAFTVGCFAVRILPRRWLFRLSDVVANIGFYCFWKFRNRSVANIAVAFGEHMSGTAVKNLARRSLRNFLRDCVEVAVALEASDGQLRALIPIIGNEHLDAALAKNAGVLVLSAHLGNFLLVGSRLAVEGYPVSVLVNQPRDGRLAKLMDDYRLQVRQKTIHARPRREAFKKLHDTLRRNEIAVIISDEYRRGKGIEVPLFGKTVIARRGPAIFSLRTGAPIVPACMIRQSDGTLKLVIEPELELDRSGKGGAQIRENMIRLTQWLEGKVRAYPDQWNWMNIRSWAAQKTGDTGPREAAHQPT